jgi:hypothetical protein
LSSSAYVEHTMLACTFFQTLKITILCMQLPAWQPSCQPVAICQTCTSQPSSVPVCRLATTIITACQCFSAAELLLVYHHHHHHHHHHHVTNQAIVAVGCKTVWHY